jgi:uncharacterized membrane protein YagU involved in acid resistance
VLKGFAAGLIGGLTATWVMGHFMAFMKKKMVSPGGGQAAEERSTPTRSSRKPGERERSVQEHSGEGQPDPTVMVAEVISEKIFHHELSEKEKQVSGPLVHYAFGAGMGGLYGAAAEVTPVVTAWDGMCFGTAVWLGADEIALPALHLSKPPQEYPLSLHTSALLAHWVYGFVTEVVRGTVRKVL